MIQEIKNLTLQGKHNKPILTDVCYRKTATKKPLVVFCHGYKGYKDWGVFNQMVPSFVEENIFLVKFNFSHNGGTVEQPIDFPDLEAFGENNLVKELDDLETVLDWLLDNNEFSEEINPEQITLIGHSRGGGIVTLKAAEDKRVKKLISWAGVSDFGARFPTGPVLEHWKKEGVAYVENARTKQQMPHYFQFYTNFIENEERLTLYKAAANIKIPHLIIHGSKDTSVEFKEAENLHKWNPNSELFVIENADHGFGSKHPWEEDFLPSDFEILLKKTIKFAKTDV
ncbi:alpha/beta hydrolase family protein [Flavicella sediminum]|uniref:alpha/beta hydrolase family protein n=1 Tax=Flavicella sediminum TaxID=2585141 RepID=UPI00111D8B06|nr:alpha/beta hydrolase [Flavicella sediminum]